MAPLIGELSAKLTERLIGCQIVPLRDLTTAYSGIMAGFYEPRTPSHGLSSDSDAALPRQTQTENDASGSPQRVAGRLYRPAPTMAPDGAILRANGFPRRCRPFEFDAAQRHMSQTRPATSELRPAESPGPKNSMNDERPTMNENTACGTVRPLYTRPFQ